MSPYDLTKHSLQVPKAIDDIDARLTALEEIASRDDPGRAVTEAADQDYDHERECEETSQDLKQDPELWLVEKADQAHATAFKKAASVGDVPGPPAMRAAIREIADWLDFRTPHEPVIDLQGYCNAIRALRAEAEK